MEIYRNIKSYKILASGNDTKLHSDDFSFYLEAVFCRIFYIPNHNTIYFIWFQ